MQLLTSPGVTGDKGDSGSSSGQSSHNSPSVIRNNGGLHAGEAGTRLGSGETIRSVAAAASSSLGNVTTSDSLAELSKIIITQEITDQADGRKRLDFGKTRATPSDLNNNVSENFSSPYVITNDGKKDLEQRDVSLESITTNNGTILNSYLSCSTKPTRQSSGSNLVLNDDPAAAPAEDKGANESLLDNLLQSGACEGSPPIRGQHPGHVITLDQSEGCSSALVDGADKQLIDHHHGFNRTDEEKLTVSGLSDEQKLGPAITPCPPPAPCSPPGNHCTSPLVSSIAADDGDKGKQIGDKNPSVPHDDHNHESAGSLIDLKGLLRVSKENDKVGDESGSVEPVQAGVNILHQSGMIIDRKLKKCRNFSQFKFLGDSELPNFSFFSYFLLIQLIFLPNGLQNIHPCVKDCLQAASADSFPVDRNKTEDNNDNMQEDAGPGNVKTFHNAAENHSGSFVSSPEVETRSATETELRSGDVEPHEEHKKNQEEDDDGAGEVAERDGADEVINEDRGCDVTRDTVRDTPRDRENVTSLEVEWLQQTLSIPFYRGVITDQSLMSRKPGAGFQDGAGAGETSLPIDFGESLPPRLSGLVNKQFRMLRLVKAGSILCSTCWF